MNAKPLPTPRWLFALAVLTVAAAVPLLCIGAEVTSKGVGMVDVRPYVNPIQAIGEFVKGEQSLGWMIEHSHRLFGWLVGASGLLLLAGTWRREPRRAVRWFVFAGVALIGVQGVLGMFRVGLNNAHVAWIHGSFAQIVFAALVTIALVMSRTWLEASQESVSKTLRLLSLMAVSAVFLQAVLGGMARHEKTLLSGRLHLAFAFAVTALLVWVIKFCLDEGFRFQAWTLSALLVTQILLGIESFMSWLARILDPAIVARESPWMDFVRSGHYVNGAMIFALVVTIAVRAHRVSALAVAATGNTVIRKWEGAL